MFRSTRIRDDHPRPDQYDGLSCWRVFMASCNFFRGTRTSTALRAIGKNPDIINEEYELGRSSFSLSRSSDTNTTAAPSGFLWRQVNSQHHPAYGNTGYPSCFRRNSGSWRPRECIGYRWKHNGQYLTAWANPVIAEAYSNVWGKAVPLLTWRRRGLEDGTESLISLLVSGSEILNLGFRKCLRIQQSLVSALSIPWDVIQSETLIRRCYEHTIQNIAIHG